MKQTVQFSEEAHEYLPVILDVLAKQHQKETMADTTKDWFYEIQWQSQPRPLEVPAQSPGSWLIFADHSGMGDKLAERLEEAGNRCVLVYADVGAPPREEPRDNNAWYLDPAEPGDFQRLFAEAFQAQTPALAGIVHLWSLDAPGPFELTAKKLTEAQTLTCASVLHLLQAGVEQQITAGLWLVTRNAVSVKQTEDSLNIAQAPLWGLGKVIAQEHPALWGALIDDPDIDSLLAEIGAGDDGDPEKEDQIAYRDGQRYVARLVRHEPAPSDAAPALNADSSYLITGGLGALGLAVAKWMVAEGARHLVLTGRRAPSEKAREVIEQLEETGARILVVSADVSDREQAAHLFEAMNGQMPPLKGVVHAAGVASHENLKHQDWESFSRAMVLRLALFRG